jgi:hypothetical protein
MIGTGAAEFHFQSGGAGAEACSIAWGGFSTFLVSISSNF